MPKIKKSKKMSSTQVEEEEHFDKYAYIIILEGGGLIGSEFPYIVGTTSSIETDDSGVEQFSIIDEEIGETMASIDRESMIGFFRREVEEDTDSDIPEEVL